MTVRPELPEHTPRERASRPRSMACWSSISPASSPGPPVRRRWPISAPRSIKIENPDGGDDTRVYEHAEIGGESAAFLSLNRNKRGIALDFTNPAALRGRARADREGGRGGGEFLRRRDEEVRPRLCLGRADQSAADLLLDLGLWPQGSVRPAPRLRSDHAGRKRLHVAERLSGWRSRYGPARRSSTWRRECRPATRSCWRCWRATGSAVASRSRSR